MPGAARLGDDSACPLDAHGCKTCSHGVQGPATQGSQNVIINGKPAVRLGDMGIHRLCCSLNRWVASSGAPTVFINGQAAVRLHDTTTHCGGIGKIIECSSNVIIGNSQSRLFTDAEKSNAPFVIDVNENAHRSYELMQQEQQYLFENSTSGDLLRSTLSDPKLGEPAQGPSVTEKPNTPITDTNSLIEKSPTLKKDLNKLENKGWKIEYNEKGKGSYADKKNKRIVIDKTSKDNQKIVRSLSHEKGHALYKDEPYVSPSGLTKEEYVERNVKRHLNDEGEATLNNIEIRDEIKSNDGPDIGVSGSKTKQYEKIYEEYKKSGDRVKAREKIGEIFADGERPSTDTSITYREYYGKVYEDYYDKNISKVKKK